MGSSGGTIGTPIGGGLPGAITDTLQPLPYTYLSIHRYARIMGISPAHFSRASAPSLSTPLFPVGSCGSVWPRYSWQNFDQVSHEELAYAIQSAEDEIARAIGFTPALDWFASEPHLYPRYFDRTRYGTGLDIRGKFKNVILKEGKYVAGGRRAVSLVGSATVAGGTLVYSDNDSDGLYETATITLATNLTNINEFKVYFTGYDGQREWEVRPVRKIETGSGNVVIYIDSWLLIEPELLCDFPSDEGFRAIDISTTANFVTTVDVYREYNDTSQVSAQFFWADTDPYTCTCGGSGCPACSYTTQDGCLTARDISMSVVSPIPASYDSTTGTWSVAASWSGCTEPERLNVWYYAGDRSEAYLRGETNDPLSDWWAQTIAWIATCRLERPLCGCTNASTLAEQLTIDLSHSARGETYFTPQEILRSPFGTRRGEIMAWKRISKLVKQERKVSYALV